MTHMIGMIRVKAKNRSYSIINFLKSLNKFVNVNNGFNTLTIIKIAFQISKRYHFCN
jgi:hypothetical protein